MTAQLAENNTLLKKISYDTARPSQDEPNFSIMPKEKVAQIRKLSGDDMTKFALELESELFAGNPEEQKMVLEKRIEGADKVQFIKHGAKEAYRFSPKKCEPFEQYAGDL
ncbi:unnamed protein product [Nippostrongylus brasiliensis]|uniref:Catalase n=1 Tax=Nippostrongylus brasiliensis TaxID=27835 RepID=A0A0N4Y3X1_NIPBR|nr:unnamed protein product [Nippostrongylus brasiliensis]